MCMNSPSRLEQNSDKAFHGLIHIYSGTGKGKTTAAVGLSLRAAGQGLRVLFCQFLKGRLSGEVAPMEKIGIRVLRAKSSEKFVFQMDEAQRALESEAQLDCFEEARAQVIGGSVDLLVLDEILDAVNLGMIPEEALLQFLDSRPAGLEVALTGRGPSEALVARADYYTDFVCLAHPYEGGVAARRGVEF